MNQLNNSDTNHLMMLLRARETLMRTLGITPKPPCFELGDKVYFITDPVTMQFKRGVLVADDLNFAFVREDGGAVHKVSPFSLIKK
jgi:hypothetical protein